ncbi:MAG: hypothetical protein WC789_03795 [Lentisphaeria bacterium]|jgi:hypothetical protein
MKKITYILSGLALVAVLAASGAARAGSAISIGIGYSSGGHWSGAVGFGYSNVGYGGHYGGHYGGRYGGRYYRPGPGHGYRQHGFGGPVVVMPPPPMVVYPSPMVCPPPVVVCPPMNYPPPPVVYSPPVVVRPAPVVVYPAACPAYYYGGGVTVIQPASGYHRYGW